jgi:hypothetical protein
MKNEKITLRNLMKFEFQTGVCMQKLVCPDGLDKCSISNVCPDRVPFISGQGANGMPLEGSIFGHSKLGASGRLTSMFRRAFIYIYIYTATRDFSLFSPFSIENDIISGHSLTKYCISCIFV